MNKDVYKEFPNKAILPYDSTQMIYNEWGE